MIDEVFTGWAVHQRVEWIGTRRNYLEPATAATLSIQMRLAHTDTIIGNGHQGIAQIHVTELFECRHQMQMNKVHTLIAESEADDSAVVGCGERSHIYKIGVVC